MRRGDIWLADLEPVRGSESNKSRPVVLVTNNAANRMATQLGRGVLAVVPITSNITRVHQFQVLLDADGTGLKKDSKAQCEQVRALDFGRFLRPIGSVPAESLARIDTALRRQLAL